MGMHLSLNFNGRRAKFVFGVGRTFWRRGRVIKKSKASILLISIRPSYAWCYTLFCKTTIICDGNLRYPIAF